MFSICVDTCRLSHSFGKAPAVRHATHTRHQHPLWVSLGEFSSPVAFLKTFLSVHWSICQPEPAEYDVQCSTHVGVNTVVCMPNRINPPAAETGAENPEVLDGWSGFKARTRCVAAKQLSEAVQGDKAVVVTPLISWIYILSKLGSMEKSTPVWDKSW